MTDRYERIREEMSMAAETSNARGEVEYEYEVWQHGVLQAGGRETDYASAQSEASHYAAMYTPDGPVEVRIYEKRLLRADIVMTFDGKTFEVDDDIADLVHALNTAGIATVASCSGHGMRPGRISLANGRELFVLPSYEIAQWFDTQFPRDINGQTADERTETLLEAKDARIAELLEERDELAKDAERYRWLRDREIPEWLDLWHQNPDRIDAAIDAAMEGETPLVELLERVPEDARAWYEHGPTNHSHIPYGLLCRRAAAEIRSLTIKLDQERSSDDASKS